MISQTTEYALRAVVYLAQHHDERLTVQRIADGTKVSSPYLSKILQSLGAEGLVIAQRGKKGGFGLAREPKEITMLDVVNAVEPIRRIRSCPLDLEEHGTHLCALHRRLDEAAQRLERHFGDATIASLLSRRSKHQPLCSFPGAKTEKKGDVG